MQWSHDADAKLMMHVLKIHDVKLNYAALAQAMGNDVTPKAIIHRIAKLRSMADDASTASNSAPGPSQPAKRTSPAKRASAPTTTAATAAAAPAGKKATATAANKTPVGTKRNAAGVAKQGNGGNGANGKAAKDDAATVADEEEEEVKGVVEAKPSAAKKLKTSKADVSSLKNGINVFEDGSAGADAGAAAAGGDDEGGVEYA